VFTAVVIENFGSLVNPKAYIDREEMRKFKQAWAEVDLDRTGYLRRRQYASFFARLSGIFEVRPYPPHHSIPALVRASAALPHSQRAVDGIDLTLLSSALRTVDYASVARRRRLYDRLYHEALVSDEPGRGMSFANMLLLLAHYKLIDDDEALESVDLTVDASDVADCPICSSARPARPASRTSSTSTGSAA